MDRYDDAIQKLVKVDPRGTDGATKWPCFARGWKMGGTVCPHADQCKFAPACKQAWQVAQTLLDVSGGEYKAPIVNLPDKMRRKWKTSKYSRKGFKKTDNPSHAIAEAFAEELALPLLTGVKKVVASSVEESSIYKTKSYHAVIHTGVVICRVWTNAKTVCAADIVPELEVLTRNLAKKNLDDLTEPVPQLERVKAKVYPCTHRVQLLSIRGGVILAKILKGKFKL